jgi:ubiquitin-protein ligase
MASKCISKLTRSWPPSASCKLNLLNYVLLVHLLTRSNTSLKGIAKLALLLSPSASPNPLNYALQVHLWVHSIWASKCISKLARSWPPSASLNSLYLGLQVTLTSHHNSLQVYLWVYLIVILRHTTNCSQPPSAASWDRPYVDRYIDAQMRIQTEYMSFKNRWTISSRYDFQVHLKATALVQ